MLKLMKAFRRNPYYYRIRAEQFGANSLRLYSGHLIQFFDSSPGSDGGIDFGLCRVGEETKHTLTLKNRGPYELAVK